VRSAAVQPTTPSRSLGFCVASCRRRDASSQEIPRTAIRTVCTHAGTRRIQRAPPRQSPGPEAKALDRRLLPPSSGTKAQAPPADLRSGMAPAPVPDAAGSPGKRVSRHVGAMSMSLPLINHGQQRDTVTRPDQRSRLVGILHGCLKIRPATTRTPPGPRHQRRSTNCDLTE
jgi:hypothetical protein